MVEGSHDTTCMYEVICRYAFLTQPVFKAGKTFPLVMGLLGSLLEILTTILGIVEFM